MFKTGKFFSIQARTNSGSTVYLGDNGISAEEAHSIKLRQYIRKKSAISSGTIYDYDDFDFDEPAKLEVSSDPFKLKLWPLDVKPAILVDLMRKLRSQCGSHSVDPNSIRLVTVECNVSGVDPEEGSDLEVELRKFALEKLTDEEKKFLKLKHWDVYHKLSDRSALEDDDEE